MHRLIPSLFHRNRADTCPQPEILFAQAVYYWRNKWCLRLRSFLCQYQTSNWNKLHTKCSENCALYWLTTQFHKTEVSMENNNFQSSDGVYVYIVMCGEMFWVDSEVEIASKSMARFCSSSRLENHLCSSECLWLSGKTRCFLKLLQGQYTLRLGNTAVDSLQLLCWASVAATMWRNLLRERIFVFRTVQAWKVYMVPRDMFKRKLSPSYLAPHFYEL